MSNITNKTINKYFTLTNINNNMYLYQHNKNRGQTTLEFFSLTLPLTNLSINTPSLDNMINLLKTIKSMAPVDVRIYLDDLEILDLEEKNTILNSLVIAEYKLENIRSFRQLTPSMLKTAQKEVELKNQLTQLLTQIESLSIRDCEKLTSALKV